MLPTVPPEQSGNPSHRMGCAPSGTSNTALAEPLRRSDAISAALLFAAALAWFSLGLGATLQPADEGYMMGQSARVAAGEMPHRDFVDVYGPGTFAVTGLAMRVLGDEILPVRRFVAFLKALAVVFGFLLVRALVPRSFAVCGAVLAIAFWGRVLWNLNAPYASLYTLAIAPAALLLLLAGERRRSLGILVAAGALAGAAVLFKQSLAVFLMTGMVLALWANGMLREPPGPRARAETRLALAAWTAVALALLVPLRGFLSAFEYALHVLPIHVAMLLVAVAVVRRGGTGSLAGILRTRLLPFGAGAATVLGSAALLYASWGALGAMLDDMFVLPLSFTNYHRPIHLPPAPLALCVSGCLALAGALLLGLAGRRRGALALGVTVPVLFAGASRFDWSDALGWLRHGPALFAGLLPAAIAWTALATLAPSLRRGALPEGGRGAVWLPLVFFHVFLAFQGFPRAGPDLFLAQGLQIGLLVVVLATWHRSICAAWQRPVARVAIAALLFLGPVWLAAEPVASVLEAVRDRGDHRALRLPRAAGIALPRAEFRRLHLADTEQLVARLIAMPGDEPVLLLSNEDLILFASGRAPLLPRERAYLFWIGWNLSAGRGIDALEARILQRLAEVPDAIVIEAREPATRYLLEALPRLRRHLVSHYRVEERIGHFRILARRSDRGGAGG